MWPIAEIIKIITPTDDELTVARVVLGVGIVVSNIAVWRGVYLENDKFSEDTKKSGWILLVRALAAEAACAALLLVVDTTIGIRQEYKIEALKASNLTLETNLEREKQKTSARPWKKEQFDALQEIKGIVRDAGVVSRPYCAECGILAIEIEIALHSAGVQLYYDPSFSGDVATGILVKLPTQDDLGTHPLVLALRKAGLNPVTVHHIPQFSKIRTDIPVIFVGERGPEFLALPYWPDDRSGWTILPLAKQ